MTNIRKFSNRKSCFLMISIRATTTSGFCSSWRLVRFRYKALVRGVMARTIDSWECEIIVCTASTIRLPLRLASGTSESNRVVMAFNRSTSNIDSHESSLM
ncbi:hypothetical protein ACKS0A_01445 [Histoplasma ohiense]